MNSDLFATKSPVARSDYWKYHSTKLQVQVAGGSVAVGGESGFYVPERSSRLSRAAMKMLRGIKRPGDVARWLQRGMTQAFAAPRLMTYDKAYDAVMSCADISVPIVSPFTINHADIRRLPGVHANAAAVNRHYRKWSGYEASGNIYIDYYYQNILRRFTGADQNRTILEIGSGNGNLASILFHDWAPVRVILIDLPETLAVSIAFLSSMFPESIIVMPHEAAVSGIPESFDFVFLTVDQLHLIGDSSVDVAINCHSLQEMTHGQIDIYFALIQRVCRNEGYFFTANRVEKIPCGPDAYSAEQTDPPNRMAEFPWNRQNQVLAYEISKLSRLAQLDAVAMRVERIHKT
jgi:putative sugar O-methyltransferase